MVVSILPATRISSVSVRGGLISAVVDDDGFMFMVASFSSFLPFSGVLRGGLGAEE